MRPLRWLVADVEVVLPRWAYGALLAYGAAMLVGWCIDAVGWIT